MEITYKNILEMKTREIDTQIAKEIDKATVEICEKLRDSEIDIIYTPSLIESIQSKNEFVQNMFKENFSEAEETLRRKIAITKRKPKDEIDLLSSKILNKRINYTLDKMLKTYKSSLETCTIFDRKIFLDMLFDFSTNQKTKKQDEEER